MNKLFPVTLMGQGTADVESLPSYLSRCAFEHGVSVGMLAKWVASLNEAEGSNFPKTLKAVQNISTLARCNQYSNALRTALIELTGQDLRCRPLEFLDLHVYCISTEITGFRWCPECFSEMEKLGKNLYFKQLWHMKPISHCNIHRTPLLACCAYCGKEQKHFSPEFPLGFCVYCEARLADGRHPIKVEQTEPTWKSNSYDIVDVFVNTAQQLPEPNPSGQHDAFWLARENNRYFYVLNREWTKVVKEYFRKWPNAKRLVSQRRLAYYLNITLFEFLSISKEGLSLPLFHAIDEDIPPHLEAVGRAYRDHVEVKTLLETIAHNHEPPVSLKVLARKGDVSVGYVEYRFPDLAKRVVERHQQYQKRQHLVKYYQAQTAALKFFTEERYADHNQSRKEAYRVLREETGLPKWMLKDAIQVAYSALT